MNLNDLATESPRASGQLARATVLAVRDDGHTVATVDGTIILCDALRHTGSPPRLDKADEVLVWHPGQSGARGVILGAVGRTANGERPEKSPHASTARPIPEEIVLEARHSLTLRVGDGSITIREDGKILIKGRDLVSHALRVNRIKGGAVSIN
jgi:hypothetical protein